MSPASTNKMTQPVPSLPSRTFKPAKTNENTSTLRHPPYTYIHLNVTRTLLPAQSTLSAASTLPPALDEVTLRAHMSAALNQYLGLTGTAIPIDILNVAPDRNEGWIRLPRNDESAVVAALAQWAGGKGGVSIRVNSRGAWLGGLIAGDRRYGSGEEKLWSLER